MSSHRFAVSQTGSGSKGTSGRVGSEVRVEIWRAADEKFPGRTRLIKPPATYHSVPVLDGRSCRRQEHQQWKRTTYKSAWRMRIKLELFGLNYVSQAIPADCRESG